MVKYTFYQFQRYYPNDDACLNEVIVLSYGDEPVCRDCASAKRNTIA